MNHDIIAGSLKQMRGRIRAGWGRIIDDETSRIEGDYEMLCGRIQKAYGQARNEEDRKSKKIQLRRRQVV